ncbi:hypothetical protein LNKW23_23590 [Paralimibaculum aggregatum]|uniref:DUF1468 domain-containing protein n=1 Tax=Paralimibaculum aggregatum TaxID=3036245 RepID=A0ABQ6LIN6_9RHOB|nr:tripartite tricarboxylate transporter TctB family protein [Limibaculum sp. NKW23]GMG83146.1 hypothetical protein LNKW23_23590 [Limibaculum sp. NKW23]
MGSRENLRRADLVTALLLIVLGGAVLWQALEMPWTKSFGMPTKWYLSPGLFPAILGVLLIWFAAQVALRALREGALRGFGPCVLQLLAGLPRNRAVWRSALALLLIGAYVLLGLGKLNYYLATSLFCLAMMAAFHRPGGRFFDLRGFGLILAVSLLGPLAVGQVFSRAFQVPLP